MKYKICFYWISTLVKSFVVLPLLLRSSHPSVGTESTLKHIKDRFELGLILADVCIFLAVTRAQTPLSFEELFSVRGGGCNGGPQEIHKGRGRGQRREAMSLFGHGILFPKEKHIITAITWLLLCSTASSFIKTMLFPHLVKKEQIVLFENIVASSHRVINLNHLFSGFSFSKRAL